MMKYIDLSERAITLIGLQEELEECYHILDVVKTSDNNSQALLGAVKDKLVCIEIEISELYQKE